MGASRSARAIAALALAAGRLQPAFTDAGGVAVGQRHNEVVDVGGWRARSCSRLASAAQAQVVLDGAVEQHDVLAHQRDLRQQLSASSWFRSWPPTRTVPDCGTHRAAAGARWWTCRRRWGPPRRPVRRRRCESSPGAPVRACGEGDVVEFDGGRERGGAARSAEQRGQRRARPSACGCWRRPTGPACPVQHRARRAADGRSRCRPSARSAALPLMSRRPRARRPASSAAPRATPRSVMPRVSRLTDSTQKVLSESLRARGSAGAPRPCPGHRLSVGRPCMASGSPRRTRSASGCAQAGAAVQHVHGASARAAASSTSAVGTSQNAITAKMAKGGGGDGQLRQVPAEEGLQLLDAVDHGHHPPVRWRANQAGPSATMVVQPAAQRLDGGRGALRHRAPVVELRAQQHMSAAPAAGQAQSFQGAPSNTRASIRPRKT